MEVQDCSEFELRRVSWTATIRNWGDAVDYSGAPHSLPTAALVAAAGRIGRKNVTPSGAFRNSAFGKHLASAT